MSYQNNRFHRCPRCREQGLEIFATHSYCLNCNYTSEDKYERESRKKDIGPIPQWALDCLAKLGKYKKLKPAMGY
jgi:hypothetical protein